MSLAMKSSAGSRTDRDYPHALAPQHTLAAGRRYHLRPPSSVSEPPMDGPGTFDGQLPRRTREHT